MSHSLVLYTLMFVIVPLWGIAGLADWFCHRRADIADRAGPTESLIHLVMLAETALPVLAALFCKIDALLIAGMIGLFCLHRVTMAIDIRYAVKHREVTRVERLVHTTMEGLALAALLSIIALTWTQFLAILGLGSARGDYTLARKEHKLPSLYIALVLVNLIGMELLPYVQELRAGLRRRERHPGETKHDGLEI